MRNFKSRIQGLPERQKKVILWSIMFILGLVLLVFYIRNFQKTLKGFNIERFKEELQLPSFEKEFKELPKIEIPKILQEIQK